MLGQEFLGFQGRHASHACSGDCLTEYRVDDIAGSQHPRER